MATKLLSLRLLSVFLLAVSGDSAPTPGRIPKVYNALITSNQNLEPSKSYPVYQPVLHDPFGFSVHPFYGGEYPFGNGVVPQLVPPKSPEAPSPPPTPVESAPETPRSEQPTETATQDEPVPPNPSPDADSGTLPPPPPPNTESPIPLNQFGLPPQVLPLGRINPAYSGFSQLGPFTYSYPGVRLYDPYDPFALGPYGFPLYRPLANVLGPASIPLVAAQAPAPSTAPSPADPSAQTPPPEPSDLNVLNYSSKDPAIPNVPPPPLPQGGLKPDKSE